MIKTKLYKASEIANIVGGVLLGEDAYIEYISTDSREKMPLKTCFVALKGDKYDGEDYVDMAIKNGAKLLISSSSTPTNASKIIVSNTTNALFKLAKHNIGKTKVIGVTGSAGKTTVKEMIRSVLLQKYKVCATPQNYNNEIGVSKTLLSIINDDFCIVEMGMRGLGEIDFLSSLARPEISIITNCGSAHIERLGNKETIFNAKTEILNYTTEKALLPSEKRFKNIKFDRVKPFFIGNGGDVEIKREKYTENGINISVIDKNFNEEFSLKIPSFQIHDSVNSLFAYKVGRICKIPMKKIKKGILEFKNCKNRGDIFKIGEITFISDCYNASFEGVKSAILSLILYCKNLNKSPFVLLGDMLEIGDFSLPFHREIGRLAKKCGVKDLLLYGDFSNSVKEGFSGGKIFASKKEIEDHIALNFGKNDVILVKGGRKMELETIIEGLKERLNEN